MQEQTPTNVIGPTQAEAATAKADVESGSRSWTERLKDSKGGRALAAVALLATLPGIGHRMESNTVETTEIVPVTTTVEIPGQFTEHVPLNYQRDFEADQTDAQQAAESAEEIVEDHPEVFDNPDATVTGVSVEGSASADNNDAPSEFTDENVGNAELAEHERGDLTALGVAGAIHNETGQDVSGVTEVTGDEDQWSPDEVIQGNELATQFGYGENATEMVNYFETGTPQERMQKLEAAPDAVADFIQEHIVDEQGADVTVDYEQEVHVPGVAVHHGSKEVKEKTTVLTDANPEGFIPGPLVAPVVPDFDYKVTKDHRKGQPNWQRIRGQKPHKGGGGRGGFTHQHGPNSGW